VKVLITGASQGIGAALAGLLGVEGSSIAVCASRASTRLDAVAAAIQAHGGVASVHVGDLANPDAPDRLVTEAVEAMGGIDVLIANAAVAVRGPLESSCVDDWDRVFAVNVRATWLLASAALPQLEATRGSVLVVGSVSGSAPHVGSGAYSASKAAVAMLVRQMAVEWGVRGVRANMVSPGFVITPRTAGLYEPGGAGVGRSEMVPLGRLADADLDVAKVAAFLVSEGARYCTGQNLVVDGGLLDSIFRHDPQVIASEV
jgi:NAD(P)-dependent dehydrogenase (short-subunit alcohol dehydrogenase family)